MHIQMNYSNKLEDLDLPNQMVILTVIHLNSLKNSRLLLEETHLQKTSASFNFNCLKCLLLMKERTTQLNFLMMNLKRLMIEFENTFWCRINFTWIMLRKCPFTKRMKKRLELNFQMSEMIFEMFKTKMKDFIELFMIRIFHENLLNQNTLIFKSNSRF